MESKKPWLSKTFWVNIIAIGMMLYQSVRPGENAPISLEVQGMILGVINMILRALTKTAIKWE